MRHTSRTFALLLALWARYVTQKQSQTEFPTSTLVLLPHRDLALQCAYWIYKLDGSSPQDTSPLVQLLLRSSTEPLTMPKRLNEFRISGSPFLIGTPQAVLEVLHEDPSALPLQRFSTVVVDEVDTMVEIPPWNGDKSAIVKFEKNLKRHPSPTRQVLDAIYRSGSPQHAHRPQLVMMSATLNKHHRHWLQQQSGWFGKKGQHVVEIYGSSQMSATKLVAATADTVVHHALVVSDAGDVTNIEGAVALDEPSPAMQESDLAEVPLPEASSAAADPEPDDAGGMFSMLFMSPATISQLTLM